MSVDSWKVGGRQKKRWMDCVKKDMKEKGVNDKMRETNGNKRHIAPTPNNPWDQGKSII